MAERVGAAYGRHIDTNPGGDPRKVTLIYYLNPGYDATQGGRLRSFGGGAAGTFAAQSSEKKDSSDSSGSSSGGGGGGGGSHDAERRSGAAAVAEFEPRGDRLVAFWSDALVHDVSPTNTLDPKSPRSSSSSAQLPEQQQQPQQEQQQSLWKEQQQSLSKEEKEEEGRHRWALTVWLRLRDASLIRERDPAAEDYHFGRGAFRRALARAAVKGGDVSQPRSQPRRSQPDSRSVGRKVER